MDIVFTVRRLRLRLGLLLALLAGAVGPLLAQTPPNLNRVEFFFDTDPGHGLATAVALPGPAAPARLGLTFPVPLGSLAPGFHRLFIRSRDANNQWSQPFGRLLFIDDNSALVAPNLAEVEHFIDTDAGFGSGSSTALTGTSVLNRTIPVSIGSLAPGFHRLFLRTRDVNNKWSQTFGRLFFVDDNSALTAPNLAEVEHFLDTDPGFGNGSSTALTGTSALNRTIPVNLGSLAPGFHRLFMRTRDVNNKWSQTFGRLIFVDDLSAQVAPNLTRAELYFDIDPGFGSGTAIPTGAAATSYTALPVAADASALADGPHRLFVRVRDANGRWSQVLNRRFVRSGCAASENLAEGRPSASYGGNLGSTVAETVFNGQGEANFFNTNTVQADLGAATRTVSEVQVSLRNPNGTAVSGTLTLEISLNGTVFTTAGSVPVALAASQTTPQAVALPLATAVAGVRAVRLLLTVPSIGQAIRMTDAGVFFFNCVNPTVTSFAPASGPAGTSVTITGTNLGGVTAVRFNGLAATVFSGVSATSVTATVPAGASTGPISLTTPNGTAVSSSSFTVTVPAPTIVGFAPTSGPTGTSVTLTGTNLGTTSAVRFNGVNAPVFAVVDATTVTATVPTGATTGVISVTTAGGTGSSSGSFTVLLPPTVASFTPTSGPVGTSVVITGTSFSGATTVTFNGTAAPGFVVNSATQITVAVPAGATTGVVGVTTPIGSGQSTGNFTVTAPAPTIASFTPTSGPVGTSVVVTGTNFSSATALTFNGLVATFVVNSATSITATVPAGATTGVLGVTTPNGSGSSAGVFRVLPLGLVTGTQAVRYDFNNAGQAPDLSGNGRAGTLTGGATIAAGTLGIGPNAVDALTLPGATLNGTQDFTITATARMAAFVSFNELFTATQSGGNDLGVYYEKGSDRWGLTVNGTDHTFGPFVATANTAYQIAAVRRGSQASFFVDGVQVGSTITVSASPIAVAATGLVLGQEQDAVGGGFDDSQAWTGSIDEIAFYRSALTPLSPGAALAVPFTVTGPAFGAGNVFTVQLSNAAGSFASPTALGTVSGTGSNTLNTTVPAVASGAGYRIRVLASSPALTGSDNGGQPIVIGGTTLPTIASFAPTSGPVGTSVVVTGTNLTGATAVAFNGTAAPGFVVNSATSLTVSVPAGATTGLISLTTPSGSASSTSNFTVTGAPVAAPVIASFAPTSGPVGTSVVVTGANFSGATALTFNGLAALFTVNSATSITATVPAGATTGLIGVTTAGGSASSASSFTVTAPLPTVASFTPTSGPVSTSVVVTGTDFTGATAVRFNGVLAPGFVVNSATQITVSVPLAASTGPVRVTTPSGSGQSVSDFTVTAAAPVIASFAPTSGPAGTSVVLTGTDFSGATALTFNGLTATFVVNSATSITATVPVGATTGLIGVTAPGGSASSATSFTVTAAPLALVARNPTRHANTAPRPTNMALTFNQALDAGTAGNVRIHSTQAGGRKAGAASASGAVLTFDPTTDFQPGEVVRVSVPATVLSAGGSAAPPTVYQFTTAVGGGAGLFSKVAIAGGSGGGGQVAQADVDGDGDLDLLAVESTNGTVQVRRNNGSGRVYAATQYLAVGAGARGLTVADFDNDGDLDFATANATANTVSVALNNGSGTFGIGTTLTVGSTPSTLTAGDVDGDGDQDLVITNDVSPGVVQVRLNNGSGTAFASAPDVATANLPVGPALGDIDHDGDLDLLVGSRVTAGAVVSIRLNNGSGTFGGSGSVSVGSAPFALVLADLNGDGNLDLAASNIGSDNLSIRLGDGAGVFGGGSTVNTGPRPNDVKAGDVDGDGDLDLLTSNNSATGPSFSVCRNDGAGGFAVTATPCGTFPQGLGLGDADGDGDLDFALLEGGLLTVHHNQAAPTVAAFAPASGGVGTSVSITGTNFLGTTTVRFNGTAVTAVAVASPTGLTVVVPPGATSGPVSVTTNSGTGTSTASFTLTASLNLTALAPVRNARASAPAATLALTFDQPLAAGTAANLRVLAPEAGGRRPGAASASGAVLTFDPTTDFRAGEVVRVSVPASIRGTGGASARPQVYQLTTAATGGSGNFGGTGTVPVGGGGTVSPLGAALADVNGDGNLDLLTANFGANSVSLRLGSGGGAFGGGSTEIPVGRIPRTVAVGDVDGDGDLDFVTSNQDDATVSVARNTGAGTFAPVTEVGGGFGLVQVALGDVDGDGDLDLLTTNIGENALGIRFNDGSGAFSGFATVSTGSGSGPFGLALADLDNDGDLDAVVTRNTAGGVAVRLNSGAGTFADPGGLGSTPGASLGTRELALGDFDGDGDLDVVAVNASVGTVSILRNNGGGTLGGGTVPCGANARGVALADVDGDSDLDLLVVNRDANTVSRRLNDGTGSFGPSQDVAIGNSGQTVATGDVDNDGDLDFVVPNNTDATVSVRLNQPAPSAIATGTVAPTSYCPAQDVDVPFGTNVAGFGAANQFRVQLSDAAGAFAAGAPLLGTLLSSTASGGVVRFAILPGTPSGTGYRVRVVSTDPVSTGTANVQNLTVNGGDQTAWTGAAGTTNWFDPNNWSCGVLPSRIVDVTLPAGLPRYPDLTGSGGGGFVPLARDLTLAAGASLTLGPGTDFELSRNLTNNGTLSADGSTLTLAGTTPQTLGGSGGTVLFDLTVNNPTGASLIAPLAVRHLLNMREGNLASGGFLTLRSDASGTAMVVNSSGSSLVTGTTTMERFINNATGVGYRHYSSPMQLGTATVQEFADDLPVFNLNPAYNTAGTSATPFPTLFKYDETRLNSGLLDNFDRGWMVPLATDPLVPGRGYTAQTAPTTTVDLAGTLSSADVNLSLSRGVFSKSGWHLLGNPFPSPLDWDLVPAAAGVNRALYVFVPNGPYSGTYRSYLPSPTPNQPGIGTNGGTKDVAAMQGFFVRATADASALVLPTAARPSSYVNPVFARGSSGGLAPLVRLHLSNAAGQADEAVVHFDPMATADFTAAYDAYKVQLNGGGLPTLWSQAGPLALSINGLPSVRQTPSIPLGVRVGQTGAYTLSAPELLNLPAGTEVWLEDQVLNQRHNLSLTPSYAFSMNVGFTGQRFFLWFQQRVTATQSATLLANARVYPNPAVHTATVELAGVTGPVEVELTSVLGQTVRRFTAQPRAGLLRETLDLSNVATGVYLVRLRTATGQATLRLLRE